MPHSSLRPGKGSLTALALAVFLLTGCGGGGDDEPSNTATADPSTAGTSDSALDDGRALPVHPLSEAEADVISTDDAPSKLDIDPPAQGLRAQAAARRCWDTPRDWLAQADGKNSDPVNMIVCLGHGVTWSQVFDALEDLPGRKFTRRWPWPPVHLKWEQVRHPAKVPYFNGYCINTVKTNLDARGWREQQFSAREGGCTYILGSGMNHFRVWQQQSSGALFIAASTEKRCEVSKHCVISYNDGRNLLFRDLRNATAKVGLKMTSTYVDTPGGSLPQADGSSVRYDGTVGIVEISR